MSTNFDSSFDNGDLIEASHIKQIFKPVEDLESGQSLFRVATGASTADKYVVDFQQAANPGGNRLTSLVEGQPIMFKATLDCNAGADLEVLLEGAPAVSGPLTLDGTAVAAGDVKQDQMVSVVYNSASGGRFDLLGLSSSSSQGGSSEVHTCERWRIHNPGSHTSDYVYDNGLYNQWNEGDHSSQTIGTKVVVDGNTYLKALEAGKYRVSYGISGLMQESTDNEYHWGISLNGSTTIEKKTMTRSEQADDNSWNNSFSVFHSSIFDVSANTQFAICNTSSNRTFKVKNIFLSVEYLG